MFRIIIQVSHSLKPISHAWCQFCPWESLTTMHIGHWIQEDPSGWKVNLATSWLKAYKQYSSDRGDSWRSSEMPADFVIVSSPGKSSEPTGLLPPSTIALSKHSPTVENSPPHHLIIIKLSVNFFIPHLSRKTTDPSQGQKMAILIYLIH